MRKRSITSEIGVAVDKREAIKWLTLAAKGGNKDAQDLLNKIQSLRLSYLDCDFLLTIFKSLPHPLAPPPLSYPVVVLVYLYDSISLSFS